MRLDSPQSDNALVLLDPTLKTNSGHMRRNAEAFAREAASTGHPFVLYTSKRMSEEVAEELRALGAEIVGVPDIVRYRRLPRLWAPMIQRTARVQLDALRDAATRGPKVTVLCLNARPQTLWAAAQINWLPSQRVVLQFMDPGRWRRNPGSLWCRWAHAVPQIYRDAARVLAARGSILGTQSPKGSSYLARELGCPVRVFPFPYVDWEVALPGKVELRPTPRIGVLNFSRKQLLHEATLEAIRRLDRRADWVIHMGRPRRDQELPALVRRMPRLEVVEGVLPPGEYNNLVASLDAILLPYDAETYRLKMSGMVIHAMCQAVVPLAPASSAPAAAMASEGLGVEFEQGNADGIVAAVENFLQRRTELARRALSRAPDCRKRHTAAGFLAACEIEV